MSNYLHEHSRESGKESRKTRGVKRGRKGSERCNMHRETRKQPASSFFFFSLFLFTSLSKRDARFPLVQIFLFKTSISFSLSLSVWQEKSRENLPRFDKFFSHKKPQFSTSPYIEFQFFESNLGN